MEFGSFRGACTPGMEGDVYIKLETSYSRSWIYIFIHMQSIWHCAGCMYSNIDP